MLGPPKKQGFHKKMWNPSPNIPQKLRAASKPGGRSWLRELLGHQTSHGGLTFILTLHQLQVAHLHQGVLKRTAEHG